MSDNERRYQGLLRKQRLELNYLLKERERLLQAQRQLSDLAGNESEEAGATAATSPKASKKQDSKKKNYPKLTKAHIQKQQGKNKAETMQRLFPKLNDDDFYPGSEHEIFPAEQARSDSKAPMAGKRKFLFNLNLKIIFINLITVFLGKNNNLTV